MVPQWRFMWLVQSRRYVNESLTSPNTEKLQYCIEHCGHEEEDGKSCIKFLHTYRCASYSSCLYDVRAMEHFIHQLLLHWELNSARLTHSVIVHSVNVDSWNVHSCNFSHYPSARTLRNAHICDDGVPSSDSVTLWRAEVQQQTHATFLPLGLL